MGRSWLIGACVLAACQVDGTPMEAGFFDPNGSASATASTTATIPAGDTEADTDPDTSDTDPDPTDASSTSDDGSSSDGGSTTGDTTDTDGGTTGSTEQPDHGMYSECTTVVDCVGQSHCVTTDDGMDGYCTNVGCLAPALDCDDPPGGSAPVVCAAVAGAPSPVCALDCSVGQDCPTGMTCQTLADGTFCV